MRQNIAPTGVHALSGRLFGLPRARARGVWAVGRGGAAGPWLAGVGVRGAGDEDRADQVRALVVHLHFANVQVSLCPKALVSGGHDHLVASVVDWHHVKLRVVVHLEIVESANADGEDDALKNLDCVRVAGIRFLI